MSDPVTLHSLLGNHPGTKALKSGRISSALVTFDYFEVKVANTQFKAMVRDVKYDFGELAIVTFLQAKAYHKPYVLLPATIVGRSQHHTIFYNADIHDGTCLYFATVSVFLAQAVGIDLSLGQQLGLLAVMLFTSKGGRGLRVRPSSSSRPRWPRRARYPSPASDSFSACTACFRPRSSRSTCSAMRSRRS